MGLNDNAEQSRQAGEMQVCIERGTITRLKVGEGCR